MIKDLVIIGHPRMVGGANTELAHQMICWKEMGMNLYIMPTDGNVTDLERQPWIDFGCEYLPQNKWSKLQGMVAISFCNKSFLRNLRLIKCWAEKTIWVNCMTFSFRDEKQKQSEGLIDLHLYQTRHAQKRISVDMKVLGKKYNYAFFDPYFHRNDFPFYSARPVDAFRFGRISRNDAAKYSPLQFQIYDAIKSPVPKEAYILGWGDGPARKVIGKPSSYMKLLHPNEITQEQFYRTCECVIMATSTFENLPRVGFEAMSSGSILVVDNKGGWTLQVEDGVTGYLCNGADDFIKKSTLLAHEPELRKKMQNAAREKLDKEWGLQRSITSWKKVFEKLENLKT